MSKKKQKKKYQEIQIPASENSSPSGPSPIMICCIIGVLVVVSAFLFFPHRNNNNTDTSVQAASTTEPNDESGKQILNVTAKGGYSPRVIQAKADSPAVLKVTTKNTFDCSSALSISSIGYRKSLPSSGTTDIDIPAQKAGTQIKGTCAMGMYSFAIQFS